MPHSGSSGQHLVSVGRIRREVRLRERRKVLSISNRDFVDLPIHAGHTVKLTGELTGSSIQVTKIEMPKNS